MLLDKLDKIEARYTELQNLLSTKEVIDDREKLQKYGKELKDLEEMVTAIREYRKIDNDLKDAQNLLSDPEMTEMAKAEIKSLEEKKQAETARIEMMLVPKDPLDEKNAIMEIRAGTGGDEAALFAGELMRMYLRYAEKKGFKTEIIESNPTGLGGYKEAVFSIIGKNAYGTFKYEGGTHRVQRVPKTEAGGRIHTSAATVAVLPEAEDVDVQIDEKELRVDTYRAGGPGGQNVNKVSSAIRITHLPTGIVVACQEERSQHQNRAKAMKLLRAKLFEIAEEKARNQRETARRIMVGSGDRSEKIRTYNFPQGRITDHRIGFTVYQLQEFMDGDIDEVIEALQTADRVAKLEKAQ
ncbi:MAG TPA: peptide chain release factor 1 [Candidatus Omnitrophota bacterium]|nr:peptide chain release factor 1 [Candidatus Omnitrophota bacterium]